MIKLGKCSSDCRVLQAKQVLGLANLNGFQDVRVAENQNYNTDHPLFGKIVLPEGTGLNGLWLADWDAMDGDYSLLLPWKETRRWLKRTRTLFVDFRGAVGGGAGYEKYTWIEQIDRWTGQYTTSEGFERSPDYSVPIFAPDGESLVDSKIDPQECYVKFNWTYLGNFRGSRKWSTTVEQENSYRDLMAALIEGVDAVDMEAIPWNGFNHTTVGFNASGSVTTTNTVRSDFLFLYGGYEGILGGMSAPTGAFAHVGRDHFAGLTSLKYPILYSKLHIRTTDNQCKFSQEREGADYEGTAEGVYTPAVSELVETYNSECPDSECFSSVSAPIREPAVYRYEPDTSNAENYQRVIDFNAVKVHMNCNGPVECKTFDP